MKPTFTELFAPMRPSRVVEESIHHESYFPAAMQTFEDEAWHVAVEKQFHTRTCWRLCVDAER